MGYLTENEMHSNRHGLDELELQKKAVIRKAKRGVMLSRDFDKDTVLECVSLFNDTGVEPNISDVVRFLIKRLSGQKSVSGEAEYTAIREMVYALNNEGKINILKNGTSRYLSVNKLDKKLIVSTALPEQEAITDKLEKNEDMYDEIIKVIERLNNTGKDTRIMHICQEIYGIKLNKISNTKEYENIKNKIRRLVSWKIIKKNSDGHFNVNKEAKEKKIKSRCAKKTVILKNVNNNHTTKRKAGWLKRLIMWIWMH